MTGGRHIRINDKDYRVEEIFAIGYERLCEVAGIDPSKTTEITYSTGLLRNETMKPGDFAPINRYTVFKIV